MPHSQPAVFKRILARALLRFTLTVWEQIGLEERPRDGSMRLLSSPVLSAGEQ